MIFADTPAFDLTPSRRALKFRAFDRECARVLVALKVEHWNAEDTDPGGFHGEVELTPTGI